MIFFVVPIEYSYIRSSMEQRSIVGRPGVCRLVTVERSRLSQLMKSKQVDLVRRIAEFILSQKSLVPALPHEHIRPTFFCADQVFENTLKGQCSTRRAYKIINRDMSCLVHCPLFEAKPRSIALFGISSLGNYQAKENCHRCYRYHEF